MGGTKVVRVAGVKRGLSRQMLLGPKVGEALLGACGGGKTSFQRSSRWSFVTATARKLACIVNGMLKHGQEYHEPDPAACQLRLEKHRPRNLKKQAATPGFELTPNSVVTV